MLIQLNGVTKTCQTSVI